MGRFRGSNSIGAAIPKFIKRFMEKAGFNSIVSMQELKLSEMEQYVRNDLQRATRKTDCHCYQGFYRKSTENYYECECFIFNPGHAAIIKLIEKNAASYVKSRKNNQH